MRAVSAASAFAMRSTSCSSVSVAPPVPSCCARATGDSTVRQHMRTATRNGNLITNPLCQAKQDVDGRAEVDGTPIALRRLETHAVRGACRRLVEPVAEAADDALHANLARGAELDVEHHVAFDFQ